MYDIVGSWYGDYQVFIVCVYDIYVVYFVF